MYYKDSIQTPDRMGLRNRVSYPNLGEDAKIIAETRFLCLGLSVRSREIAQWCLNICSTFDRK
jgi:hypothetical protein